jgi:hypothetical protein
VFKAEGGIPYLKKTTGIWYAVEYTKSVSEDDLNELWRCGKVAVKPSNFRSEREHVRKGTV